MSDYEKPPIRLLIVDDHPVVRAGLKSMLGTYPDLKVSGCVADGDQAIATIGQVQVDVVLLDLRMPRKNGIETMSAMKRLGSQARFVMLTSYESEEEIYQSVRAGALGYLLKASPEEQMIEAIYRVNVGQRYLPPEIASRLADRIPRANLTSLQNKIVNLMAKGMTDDQIATNLHIPDHIVWRELNSMIEAMNSESSQAPGAPSRQRITISEIASIAGVSMSTVSRVLHGSGRHTEKTKEAVMKVVRDYDFQVNNTAASLAMMRSHLED